MDAADISETVEHIYQATLRHIPKENLHTYCRDSHEYPSLNV
jgi:hypothetical protein